MLKPTRHPEFISGSRKGYAPWRISKKKIDKYNKAVRQNDSKKEQTHMPHKEDYDRGMGNMSDGDYQRVIAAIHEHMDKLPADRKVFVSSHIPGKDWSNTPYDPVYIACNKNWQTARLFFGQLVWDAVQQHDDTWVCMRQERSEGEDPIGLTYFQITGS